MAYTIWKYVVVGTDNATIVSEISSFDSEAETLQMGATNVPFQVTGDIWLKIDDITVPQGATIDNAYIEVMAVGATSGTTVNIKIQAEDVDDATAFTNYAGYAGATWTSASVDWDDIGAFADDTWYSSPDIKTVVQEIVNRDSWASGNAMGFKLANNNSSTGAVVTRDVSGYGRSWYFPMRIVITYSTDTEAFVEADWDKYREITVQSSKVPANMPDGGDSGYVVDLVIDPPNGINDDTGDLATTLFDRVVNYANDIAFTDSTGTTQYDHGIKKYVATNGSEYLAAAIRISSISASENTDIRIYYRDDGTDIQERKTAVVPTADNYVGYWTLEEANTGSPSADFPVWFDWTTNMYDGLDDVDETGQAGQIGSGQQFDGASQRDSIYMGTFPTFNTTNFSATAWINWSGDTSNYQRIITKWSAAGRDFMMLLLTTTGHLNVSIDNGDNEVELDSAPPSNEWAHVAFVKAADTLTVYLNNSPTSNTAGDESFTLSADELRISDYSSGGGQSFIGHIDECVLHNTNRSANWITTLYNCQSDNNAFWVVGAEKAPSTIYNQDYSADANISEASSDDSAVISGEQTTINTTTQQMFFD